MPAKSESQRRLMAMVYSYKKGTLDTSKLSKSLLEKIKKIAGGMSKQSAKDFAVKETVSFKQFLTEVKNSHNFTPEDRRQLLSAAKAVGFSQEDLKRMSSMSDHRLLAELTMKAYGDSKALRKMKKMLPSGLMYLIKRW